MLTREEFASVFNVSVRTVTRWKDRFDLPTEEKNARVIRYSLESVLIVCAQGVVLHTENALKHGLIPEQVLALAAQRRVRAQAVKRDEDSATTLANHSVLVATNSDDRQLIALWRDEQKGQLLRAMVRMMAAAPVASARPENQIFFLNPTNT